MARFKLFCILFLLFGMTASFGQEINRYAVYFTDKENSPYSVNEPLEFLSQRSLDRRAENGFGVTVEDLPVNPGYVNQLSEAGAEVYFTSRWLNAALVQMDASLIPTIETIEHVDRVHLMAPGEVLSRSKVPYEIATSFDTPASTIYSSDDQIDQLGVDVAHADGYTGEGVLIAVLDGGFENTNEISTFRHLHDEGRIVGVRDFVTNSGNPYIDAPGHAHGTKVLSTIAGIFEPDFTGAAPGAEFLLAVTEEVETENPIEEFNWLLGAEFADSAGADIINSSLSYGIFFDNNPDYPRSSFDGQTTLSTRAANFAAHRGILVVTSAGNDGPSGYVLSPADSPYALAVGGVDRDGNRWLGSSIGPTADGRLKPDVVAMGTGVAVVSRHADIVLNSGTSFASPLMAGLAALIMEKYPDLSVSQIRHVIKSAGHLSQAPDNEMGNGIPTYSRVVAYVNDVVLGNDPISTEMYVYPNPFEDGFTFTSDSFHDFRYRLTDLRGKVILTGEARSSFTLELDQTYPEGMYFLQVHSDHFSETFKLLKN